MVAEARSCFLFLTMNDASRFTTSDHAASRQVRHFTDQTDRRIKKKTKKNYHMKNFTNHVSTYILFIGTITKVISKVYLNQDSKQHVAA